ncbi:MATE family efflux transporter [Mobilitalea sibirica]|uniref:Multidrug export protein MepA n=1 Tax=Mobilitalea sibirica TaxID=1462919 RepID=A0A8J7HAG4_9FIRM|nr:MATE family efflux transporter [Mobilitalea sibirica]MBH1939911.1 MATE family efflux transporter [Mobilitalea sibirica]
MSSQRSKVNIELDSEPIRKLIVKLSLPSMIGIISYNLYNIIDTIYVSKLIGVDAAGGLAVSFPLFVLLSAVSTTLGSGASSLISRAIGNKDYQKANIIAANTFVVFWLFALLMTVTGLLFLKPMLFLMGVTEHTLSYAMDYCRIILIGAVTSTGFSSLMRAEGASRYAMYQWVIPILVNIILDPIFIFGFKLGITGAALATIISQCASVMMFVYFYFISKKSLLSIRMKHFHPNFVKIKEILIIGFPSLIQMSSYAISVIIINHILGNNGDTISIGTYGISNKIFGFFLIPIHGLVQGIQPIIGYNYGAGKYERAKTTLMTSIYYVGVYGIIIAVLFMLLSNQLMKLFSDQNEVIELGSFILKIIGVGIAFFGMYTIQSIYFTAIGKAKIALFFAVCHNLLCFVPMVIILNQYMGSFGVWISFPASNILTWIITTVIMLHSRYRA